MRFDIRIHHGWKGEVLRRLCGGVNREEAVLAVVAEFKKLNPNHKRILSVQCFNL